jgi:large subunit ribosomal protein L25
MSDTIELSVDKRELTGKKVAAVRSAGHVPATVYEKGEESINISVPYLPMSKAWKKAGKGQPIYVTIDGKKRLVMIKDVHMDPVKNTIMHVAFHVVNIKEKIEAEVTLQMVGQAPASQQGLIVRLNHTTLLVKGLPTHIPDAIEIDISGVENHDDDIRASALNIPGDMEMLTDPEEVIVSVVVPRAEVEKQAEEEVSAADVPSDNGSEKPAEASSEE